MNNLVLIIGALYCGVQFVRTEELLYWVAALVCVVGSMIISEVRSK